MVTRPEEGERERGQIEGDVETGVLPAGQSYGMIGDVVLAGDVVRQIVEEAALAMERMQSLAFRQNAGRIEH